MSTRRSELLRDLDRALRETSGQSVLFSEAVASSVGIHPTDLEALDLLARHGPMTAGRLAELTGLSTAAVTALIDRLEARGYARRRRDPEDRRKVYVEVELEPARAEIQPLYKGLSAGMEELLKEYSTDELARIRDFLEGAHAVVLRQTQRLRGQDPARGRDG